MGLERELAHRKEGTGWEQLDWLEQYIGEIPKKGYSLGRENILLLGRRAPTIIFSMRTARIASTLDYPRKPPAP